MSMDKELSLINALTYQLPGSITRPLYLEYKSRMNEIEMIVWTKEHHIPALQNSVENSFCKVWSEETLQYFFILANNLIGNTKRIGSRQYGQPYASVRAMNTEALYETVGVENDTHNVPT